MIKIGEKIISQQKKINYVEFKSSRYISAQDAKGFTSFLSENKNTPCYVVSPEGLPRELKESITHMNWKDFFKEYF